MAAPFLISNDVLQKVGAFPKVSCFTNTPVLEISTLPGTLPSYQMGVTIKGLNALKLLQGGLDEFIPVVAQEATESYSIGFYLPGGGSAYFVYSADRDVDAMVVIGTPPTFWFNRHSINIKRNRYEPLEFLQVLKRLQVGLNGFLTELATK